MVIAQNFMQLDKPKTKQQKNKKNAEKCGQNITVYIGVWYVSAAACVSFKNMVPKKKGTKTDKNKQKFYGAHQQC